MSSKKKFKKNLKKMHIRILIFLLILIFLIYVPAKSAKSEDNQKAVTSSKSSAHSIIINNSSPRAFKLINAKGVKTKIIGDVNLGKEEYMRIEIPQDLINNTLRNQPCIVQKLDTKIKKGDVLKLSFMARSPKSTSNVIKSFILQEGAALNRENVLIHLNVITSDEWKEYAVVKRVKDQITTTKGMNIFNLAVGFGNKVGVIEIKHIKLQNFGQDPDPIPVVKFDWFGGTDNPDRWRIAAKKRIEKIRMGDLTVKVVNKDGKPVQNADITVNQKNHKFKFATAINSITLFARGADGERYREVVKKYFNYVSFENEFKWKWRNKTVAFRMLEWTEANELPVYGHVLYWPKQRMLPGYLSFLKGTPLSTAVKKHVREYAHKFRGRIDVWDVINEARSMKDPKNFGGDLLAEVFKIAREEDPDVKLAYNENGILDWANGDNDSNRLKFYEVFENLKSKKAPIDQIGLQSHINYPFTPIWKMLEILDEVYQVTGLPIQITEFDLACPDDKVHGAYIMDFLTAVFSHPAVSGFTMWGFWEGNHWKAKEGGFWVHKDWTYRDAMKNYIDLVSKKWWSNERGTTNMNGSFTTRVFLGQHEIKVTSNGKSFNKTVYVTNSKGTKFTINIQ